jgi:hypothetical protein
MLSPTNPRRLDEPITVSLEALVPADHVYSHLAEVIGSRFPSIVRAEKSWNRVLLLRLSFQRR